MSVKDDILKFMDEKSADTFPFGSPGPPVPGNKARSLMHPSLFSVMYLGKESKDESSLSPSYGTYLTAPPLTEEKKCCYLPTLETFEVYQIRKPEQIRVSDVTCVQNCSTIASFSTRSF